MKIKILYLFFFITVFGSCENDLNTVKNFTELGVSTPEIVKNVNIIYSEKALLKVELKAPVLERYFTPEPYLNFTSGVSVVFFDDKGAISSTLSAKHAVRKEQEHRTELRDSVVWISPKNERLETEELIWDEQKKLVYSEKDVKITTATESISGKKFEADQNFTRYRIHKITGIVQVKSGSLP